MTLQINYEPAGPAAGAAAAQKSIVLLFAMIIVRMAGQRVRFMLPVRVLQNLPSGRRAWDPGDFGAVGANH